MTDTIRRAVATQPTPPRATSAHGRDPEPPLDVTDDRLRTLTLPPVRLTELTDCGGCAAKLGADLLADALAGLGAGAASPDLLSGLAPADDAAVYRISDDLAVIGTVDFFPPLVDDART